MKKLHIIDVGKDFSLTPHGRFTSDSTDSAEQLFILMHDVLEEGCFVELQFHNTLRVGSCFLQHLAKLTVANHFTKKVTVTTGDEMGWDLDRWDRYIKAEDSLEDFKNKDFLSVLSCSKGRGKYF